MSVQADRRLGFVFGVLGAVLLILDALLRFARGVVFLATGFTYAALGSIGSSILFVVVGLLIGFFAFVGRHPGSDRSLAAGVILIVLALLGWLVLGFGGSLLAILAGVLTIIAGILFLVGGR
jgi:hypothetical protein